MTYHPLPKELTIKESTIEGLGLFALVDIKVGHEFGITHHVYESNGLIRTPLGGFYNHSDNPNCETYALEYLGYRKLRAIKDIKAGEELTAYYTLYSILNHEHDWDRLHTDSRQEWTDEYYQCECGEEKIVRTEHEVSVE